MEILFTFSITSGQKASQGCHMSSKATKMDGNSTVCSTVCLEWPKKSTPCCWPFLMHYGDVIMGAIASQITSLTIVYSTVYSDADQKNIKAPRHWPLCGEFTGHKWPVTRKNVSIWWRHHRNPALSGRFPSKRASNAETESISWDACEAKASNKNCSTN